MCLCPTCIFPGDEGFLLKKQIQQNETNTTKAIRSVKDQMTEKDKLGTYKKTKQDLIRDWEELTKLQQILR